jgi:glutamate dehydrogenase/leucine dehydrogenase
MITGYGVSESICHYYDIFGGGVKGKKVIVQGWGNVGSAAAFYMAQAGAKIVGIIDRDGGLINEQGFSFEEITELFKNKKGNTLVSSKMIPFAELSNKIWDVKAEVFLPCAASRLVTKEQVERMIKSGVEVISAGANVPFADPEIFFGPIANYADENLSVIPDFISNCGMARVFAYLMSNDLKEITDEGIFNDTSNTIKKALENIYKQNKTKKNIAKTAFEIALKQLV